MRKYTKTETIENLDFEIEVTIFDEEFEYGVVIKAKGNKYVLSLSKRCDYNFPWEDYYIAKEITKLIESEDVKNFTLSCSLKTKGINPIEQMGFVLVEVK